MTNTTGKSAGGIGEFEKLFYFRGIGEGIRAKRKVFRIGRYRWGGRGVEDWDIHPTPSPLSPKNRWHVFFLTLFAALIHKQMQMQT